MRVLTINELLRMTRKELCDLAAHSAAALRPTAEDHLGVPQRSSTCATSAPRCRGGISRRESATLDPRHSAFRPKS